MAALNPPRVLPGLGRSMVNFLIESSKAWDDDALAAVFQPPGVTDGTDDPVKDTLSTLRAVGVLTTTGGTLAVAPAAGKPRPFDPAGFRRLLLARVFDLDRDGDPWSVAADDAWTSGARDLSRALSWLLAQDALGPAVSWENAESLQHAQFPVSDRSTWAITNDARFGPLGRWAVALGLAAPSLRPPTAFVPLPTVAVADVVAGLPAGQRTIQEFLDALAARLPVLPGGALRQGLVRRLGADPDPGVRASALDTSVAQALKILEARQQLRLHSLADAAGLALYRDSPTRITHVTVLGSRK